MRAPRWLFLLSSAVLYGLALIVSSSLWWASFVFLVPFLYVAGTRSLSFKEGFLYGLLLWGIPGFAVLYSLAVLAQGPLLLRCAPSCIILIFEAICTGLWFWVTAQIIQFFSLQQPFIKALTWSGTTALYFYWVIHLSLGVFNTWEGYFLMHPLLPLIEHPSLLSLLPSLGKELLLLILIGTNLFLTIPFLVTHKGLQALAVLGLMPWGISYLHAPEKKAAPAWLSHIAHLAQMYSPGTMLTPMAEDIQKECLTILAHHPEVRVILMPESSLDAVNLSTAHELGHFWNEKSLHCPIQLVLGAFFWEGDSYRNTIYWLSNGIIKEKFHKKHAMALTETLSSWYDYPCIRELYYSSAATIVRPSHNMRPAWQLIPGTFFVPYICSELFFNDAPDDHYPNSVILALCNDNWSKLAYLRRLMFLTAQFKALEWQREIVYVSYYYNGYVSKQGRRMPLN